MGKTNKSFYDWCVENNHQDWLDLWDYNLNDYTPQNIMSGSEKKYYFKCPCGKHESELKSICVITRKNRNTKINCNKCNSFAQWGTDNICQDFLNKYWDYEKNKNIDPWKIAHMYNGKVWIKCRKTNYHGSYEIACNKFIKGERCPYCNSNSGKIHKFDSLGCIYPQVFRLWSDKNDRTPYEVSPYSHYMATWKCGNNIHVDYIRRVKESTYANFNCPECVRERDESFLQEKTRLYLSENLGYKINHEYDCTLIPQNPKLNNKKGQLPFDNEIIINNSHLIIEVNGVQHYKLNGYHQMQAKHNNTTPEEEFHKQRLHDRYKRYVAYCNGYFYLAIPYTADNKEETYKKMIDDKIKEIKQMLKTKSVA